MTAATCCRHDITKLPPGQHISEPEKPTVDREIPDTKESLQQSPGGECSFFQGRISQEEEVTSEGDGTLVETVEQLFVDCFQQAFPGFRPPTRTSRSMASIADLSAEIEAGRWAIPEIRRTWSHVFPIWWRFVTDTSVRSYNRDRPDRFCATTYLSEMYNYLLTNEPNLDEEAKLGALAPSSLRRAVLTAFDETGGVAHLTPRDPDDAVRQLRAGAGWLKEYGITSGQGVQFIARLACYFGEAGRCGRTYWTPEYESIGGKAPVLLEHAWQDRANPRIREWAMECVEASSEGVSASQADEGATYHSVDVPIEAAVDTAGRIVIAMTARR